MMVLLFIAFVRLYFFTPSASNSSFVV